MKLFRSVLPILLLMLCAFNGKAQITFSMGSDPTFKADPSADSLFDVMKKTMREFKSFSYAGKYHFGELGKEVYAAHFCVWMEKPSLLRFEAYDWKDSLTGTIVHDGRAFLVYWPDRRPEFKFDDSATYANTSFHRYMHISAEPKGYSIKKQAGQLGSPMLGTALDPAVFFDDSATAAAPSVLKYDGAVMRGIETVSGEDCYVIERVYNSGQRKLVTWISTSDFIPRRAKEISHTRADWAIDEYWLDIKVNAEIPDSLFRWEPPTDWKLWYRPNIVDSKSGKPLPDFEFHHPNGDPLSLSSLRGKTVLLYPWNLTCPPSRDGIVHLQASYAEYKSKGVEIVSIIAGYDPVVVREFLAKNNVSFLTIIDTSLAANRFIADSLSISGACPSGILVDEQGIVKENWFEFEKSERRFRESLK